MFNNYIWNSLICLTITLCFHNGIRNLTRYTFSFPFQLLGLAGKNQGHWSNVKLNLGFGPHYSRTLQHKQREAFMLRTLSDQSVLYAGSAKARPWRLHLRLPGKTIQRQGQVQGNNVKCKPTAISLNDEEMDKQWQIDRDCSNNI